MTIRPLVLAMLLTGTSCQAPSDDLVAPAIDVHERLREIMSDPNAYDWSQSWVSNSSPFDSLLPPNLKGRAEQVNGDWVLIRPRTPLDLLYNAQGCRFAVHVEGVYKGEALIIGHAYGRYVCRMVLSVEGQKPEVGDEAWTRTH